ncbi:DUF2147 domain-containing protein [Acinetobacter bereziniae]|uniref:DUF2147 domain-containing protein n=1 Tax=Acinetobacter bereziniae NIPH 3 TaxID=1217651 RepID=N8YF92_ACIBZ|nr:DUF2147 domain-containing protein [Acinetobacter bereziniae]ENV19939.1 hypothetical protein F963_03984 [Acinetobacter bereziniae NIPH 3]
MKIKALVMFGCLFFTGLTQAADLAGKWKAIDDKTGYSRADVEISKNPNGTYSGKIYNTRPLPNSPLVGYCHKCKGNLKDAPIVGLKIIDDFKQSPDNPSEYVAGHVLDPLSGNVYSGKIKINPKGNRLTLRGYIGISLLGRSQTWVRIE